MANRELKVPTSIQSLVKERDGHGLQLITGKTIFGSDLSKHQHRLLIPKDGVQAIQMMLSKEEVLMANSNGQNGGLAVRLFPQNRFRIEEVKLKQRKSNGSIVINGAELNVFRAWSGLSVNDIVQMWGFRDGRDGKLCIAICKKPETDIS